ncbi:MAG: Qat anti-phage system associated protein QatB, partial [Variibacter sp.]
PPAAPPAPPARPPIPPVADPARFSAARNNFSRFAGSGGSDRKSLGRAVSHYVGSSAGGARTAAARMGSARGAGSRLLGFLSDAVARGATEALRALNLGALAGRPIEEIFLGLADYVCPDGGSIDEGIAREAFIETITDLAGAGITDLDGLTADQMQTVFELYATNAIEARLCNDIGAKTITLPSDSREAARVQAQLNDFIRRGVADALTVARAAAAALTPDRVLQFVGRIYEQAFGILQIMGDAEAEGT